MKLKKITTFCTLAAIVLLSACKKDTYEEKEVLCPLVTSTNPADQATNTPTDQIISVEFNKELDPATINATSIIVEGVNGTVSYSGVTATFTPSDPLAANSTFIGKVKTSVKDEQGNALQEEYFWTFSTAETVSPTVASVDPANTSTGVVLNKTIVATFNMAMDPATINANTFTLTQAGTTIAGTISYNGNKASFNPSADLSPDTEYTATITTAAENPLGIGIANDYVWTFTTGTLAAPTVTVTNPDHNDVNVPVNTVVTATFSEAMDPATLDGASFLLMNGTVAVNGAVTYNGLTATFTPSSDLDSNTLYSATVTTDAENMTGTGLANSYDWSFTTESGSPFNPSIDLNSVARFGIISGVGVSNNAGPSQINNLDVGIYPGVRSSITGFFSVDGGPGNINNGDFYAADDAAPVPAMLVQAKNDLTSAYLAAEGASSPAPATVSGDIGGQTLPPGIYKSTSTLSIQNGNLTLDGQGDPNAEWIFQVASDFTTLGGAPFPSPAGGNVILIGGAQAKNVIWQVGSSATIGDYTSFQGNILALTSVTMNAFSQVTGRMLCSNGSVTLTSTNTITKP